MSRRLDRLQRGLAEGSLRRLRQYRVEQRKLLALTEGAEGSDEVRQLERDRLKILRGAQDGYEAAILALTGRAVRAIFQLRSQGKRG